MDHFITASLILLIVYVLIIIEIIPKSVSALLGAVLMIILGLISQEKAFEHLDLNVIFLLTGMMIIVNITNRTGVFHWVAVESVKLARGHPLTILILFTLITALFSAFLDNVTTVLLMAPVTIFVAKELGVSIYPYFISEIIASNIGGTATLIGDPPNIMIGSAAGYDFIKFLSVLGPVTLIILIVTIGIFYFIFRKSLAITKEKMEEVVKIDSSQFITDKKLLIKSLIVLGAVIIGFIIHGIVHLEAATIALAGAAVLLIFSDPVKAFEKVEWTTIFFFIGLFIVVGGVQEAGVIKWMANESLKLTYGNVELTSMLILWLSGFLSAIIDNIPYTATMIPMVNELGKIMPVEPLWWSLALGACLGGNGTIIGASANVIMSDIARDEGCEIKFIPFLKYGIPVMIVSLIISSIYLWLLFF